ncbi:hypothetical protein GZ78_14355 [Endozoicomonas numazuensis]|uniref:Uncharacterized protein n=1 Tax=Endozoicomonas numazuensis TaxID=1137799 RepID=A0A081NF48_9GAMM|nr:hypothetical protein GZ78_14355 [Endozoicomonas numazuensis]
MTQCGWPFLRKYLFQGATIEIQQLSTLASLLFLSSELFIGSEPAVFKLMFIAGNGIVGSQWKKLYARSSPTKINVQSGINRVLGKNSTTSVGKSAASITIARASGLPT